jgi:hypothetical protein
MNPECSRLASRVEELREYLDWKVGHASKRIHEVDGLGNHHIPLDSQLNGYLQGERDMANDALKKLHELGLAGAHAEGGGQPMTNHPRSHAAN